jgi:hypothetical protein
MELFLMDSLGVRFIAKGLAASLILPTVIIDYSDLFLE